MTTSVASNSEPLSSAKRASSDLKLIYDITTGNELDSVRAWIDFRPILESLIRNPTQLNQAIVNWTNRSAIFKPSLERRAPTLSEATAGLRMILQIGERIDELHACAAADNEPFSETSHADLRRFLSNLPFVRKPSIFLLENGNLRAVWKNDQNELIGLQFIGGGAIQFVSFHLREEPAMMSRACGVDNHESLRRTMRDDFGHMIL